MVATNKPRTRKDSASPAARATGPNLCSETAVPKTTGRSGRTQGEKIERSPAANAKARDANSMLDSKCFLHDRFDCVQLGNADRPGDFVLVLERHQRAFFLDFKLAQGILLRIEVHVENGQVLELRSFGKRRDNGLLSLALRAPRCRDMDRDRFTSLDRRLKRLSVIGVALGGVGR